MKNKINTMLYKLIPLLPKIPNYSLGFSFVGVIILNFLLASSMIWYVPMQVCFWIYNFLQVLLCKLFLIERKNIDYKAMSKKELIDMHIRRDKVINKELIIMTMFLIITSLSLLLYIFWGMSMRDLIMMIF